VYIQNKVVKFQTAFALMDTEIVRTRNTSSATWRVSIGDEQERSLLLKSHLRGWDNM
jgi:hypothetical protein